MRILQERLILNAILEKTQLSSGIWVLADLALEPVKELDLSSSKT